MNEYKYHIIYKTTNLINGKIYVGMHSTDNLNGRQRKFNSIQECADTLGFARGNIRNLLYKGIRGRRGWKISYC